LDLKNDDADDGEEMEFGHKKKGKGGSEEEEFFRDEDDDDGEEHLERQLGKKR